MSAGDWKITGVLRKPVTFEWKDGQLTGSREAMEAVHELLAELAATGRTHVPVTPTGPWVTADITDSLGALVTAMNTCRYFDVSGDPPEVPYGDVPPGAIA